jgi:uncharacterized protein (TIGR00730 family)
MLTVEGMRARLGRVLAEYCELDSQLHEIENTNFRVCIFGSARLTPADPIYETVFALARALAEHGVDVVTGGGPGLMEAANAGVRAACDQRSKSYGLPLDLPNLDELPNRHLDIKSAHRRFSSRLDEFIRLSHAVVVAPGGIGTMLELMYVWQLLQMELVAPRPIILLGKTFWEGLLEWTRRQQLANGFISRRDYQPLHLVDTPEQALRILLPWHEGYRPPGAAERVATRQTRGLPPNWAGGAEPRGDTLWMEGGLPVPPNGSAAPPPISRGTPPTSRGEVYGDQRRFICGRAPVGRVGPGETGRGRP